MTLSAHQVLPSLAIAWVALAHAVFAYKQLFDWEASAVNAIGMTPQDARASAPVGRNQGLYNVFIAAGATWALVTWWFQGPSDSRPLITFFSACAVLAGLFGWVTFRRTGFLTKQMLPGIAGVFAVWIPLFAANS